MDEHFLQVTREYLFMDYIKFSDRGHNLRICQKMSKKSILNNVSNTKTVPIPIARKPGCHKTADGLMDLCMLAQQSVAHENIAKLQKALENSSQKSINKTINAIRSYCTDKVNFENIDGRIELPLPLYDCKRNL